MRFIVFLIGIFISITSQGQGHRTISTQEHVWLAYTGTFKLNEKLNFYTEYQWRRADLGKNWQQSLPRIGIEYKLKPGISLMTGYAFITSFPYGEQPAAYLVNEHRAWQQLSISNSVDKLKFSHRYRFEQRWPELKAIDSTTGNYKFTKYNYVNRVRYRLMATYNLKHFETANNDLFAIVSDEVFINFGKNIAKNIFDQNRIYAAIGMTFKTKVQVTLGYLNQFILKSDGVRCENNHTLQVGLNLML